MLDFVRRIAGDVRRMREQRHDQREQRGRPEQRLHQSPDSSRRNFAGSSSRRCHRGGPSPTALQRFSSAKTHSKASDSRRPQIDGRFGRSARAGDFDALDLLRLACLHFPLPAPGADRGFQLRLDLAPEGRELGSAERAPCAVVGEAFALEVDFPMICAARRLRLEWSPDRNGKRRNEHGSRDHAPILRIARSSSRGLPRRSRRARARSA